MLERLESPRHLKIEPENSGFLYFDPEELFAVNPAGQIINPRSIQQMEGRFDPNLFDTPKIVKVATPEGILWLITDGLNRLHYAAAHKGDTFPSKPGFSLNPIKVFDATESYLQNPKVVIPGEHPQELKALTLREYYRAVLPPTAVHAEIAPQRVAVHLIRIWEGMVGKEVAKKFSLIAALEHASMQTNDNFVADQTQEEKGIITRALREIKASAQEHNLSLFDVKKIAFMLVVNRSQIIGGEIKALQEVQGLMYHPEIDRKLKERFHDAGQREAFRSNIGQYVANMLQDGPKDEYSAPRYLDNIRGILTDKRLSMDNVRDIFTDLDPQKPYEKILREKNFAILEAHYKSVNRIGGLSEFEAYFIEKFGKVVRLDNDLSILATIIRSASSELQEARTFYTELEQIADTLIKTGVTAELIKSSLQVVEKDFDDVQNRRNPNTLKDGINHLKETIATARKQIKQQQCLYWAGNIIVKETGSFDTGTAYFLIRQLDLMNQPLGKGETHAQQLLHQLGSLDRDLHHEVVTGLARLDVALRQQTQRRIKVEQPQLPRKSADIPVLPVAVSKDTAVPDVRQDVTMVDKDRAEIKRKEINNQRLARVLLDALETISDIDLDPKDYDQRTKDMMHSLTRQLGKLSVGHPDILRTYAEWKRSEDEKTKARINKIENDQEEAQKDTRTKQ